MADTQTIPEMQTIPVPLKQRWLRLRSQVLPIVSLGICGILVLVLWGRRVNSANTIGEAQADQTSITAVASGVLLPLPDHLRVLDRVRKGQPVANVDEKAILSPVDGVVTDIRRRPGQTVSAGETILTITSEQPAVVLAYVRQDHHIKPMARMPVELRARNSGGPAYQTAIERVGLAYEPIPQHQSRDQKVTEWGVPVMISIPPAMRADLRPGELVEVRLKGGLGASIKASN